MSTVLLPHPILYLCSVMLALRFVGFVVLLSVQGEESFNPLALPVRRLTHQENMYTGLASGQPNGYL